jgi:hypothetical protein
LPKHLSRWYAALGTGRCGALEDPAEDVFVGLVSTPRGNFRVLEGIWESGTFYLQRVINVVESMPTTGAFGELRESVYALLALSEAMCEGASLARYQLGNPTSEESLPPRFANAADGLRRRARFSQAELDERGIPANALREFIFDPNDRARLLTGSVGHTLLERFPVVSKAGTYYLLLPTAVTAAIRQFVVERVNDLGVGNRFLEALADEYSELMYITPLLGKVGDVPVQFQNVGYSQLASVMTAVDEGRYLNFIFFLDTLERFRETGLTGPNPIRTDWAMTSAG